MKIKRIIASVLTTFALVASAVTLITVVPTTAGATTVDTAFCTQAGKTPTVPPVPSFSAPTVSQVATYVTGYESYATYFSQLATLAPTPTLVTDLKNVSNDLSSAASTLNTALTAATQYAKKKISATTEKAEIALASATFSQQLAQAQNALSTVTPLVTSTCSAAVLSADGTKVVEETAAALARDAEGLADTNASSAGVVPPANTFVKEAAQEISGATVTGSATGWTVTENGYSACFVIPAGVNAAFTVTGGACSKK